MVKHTQTIRRLLPTNCLSVFDDFVGFGAYRDKQISLDVLVSLFSILYVFRGYRNVTMGTNGLNRKPVRLFEKVIVCRTF